MPQLILTILLVAIGWFFLIRPQQARVREQRALVAALEPGDHVITAGGIHGVVTALAADTVRLEVAEGVTITLARAAVVRRLSSDSVGSSDSVASRPDPGDAAEPSAPAEPGAHPLLGDKP